MYRLSAQHLVDCSARPEIPELSNNGCEYGHYDECAIYLNVSIISVIFKENSLIESFPPLIYSNPLVF